MSEDKPKLFVPLDIETTGTAETEDFILEIGWVVCNDSLEEVTSRRSFIVDHGSAWQDVWSRLRGNEYVRNMHATSGLAADLMAKPAYDLHQIAKALRIDLQAAWSPLPVDTTTHLLGFSVDFDRRFLKAEEEFFQLFPEEDGNAMTFHHRLYDLSGVKIAYELAGIPIPEVESGGHRALDDAIESLEFARAIRHDLINLHLGTEL